MEISHFSNFFKKYEQFVSRDVLIRDTLVPFFQKKTNIEIPRENISVSRGMVSIRMHPAYQTQIRISARLAEKHAQEKLGEKIRLVC